MDPKLDPSLSVWGKQLSLNAAAELQIESPWAKGEMRTVRHAAQNKYLLHFVLPTRWDLKVIE